MAKKTGGTLHHWFKGSKSKDGKPGWVQSDGSPCANEPGETKTPKCFSSGRLSRLKKSKRGKSIIRSAVLRKRREDKGQQQKSGAASPTYVKTFSRGKKDPLYVKAEPGIKESMELQEATKDRPDKGSGKKDACYYKVKSRVKVWPSAYASGMLVQCRKKGAANWGIHSEEYVNEEKKYCHICMKKKYKCKCSRMPITESRRLSKITRKIPDALLALSFFGGMSQSPEHFIGSIKPVAPGFGEMERTIGNSRKKPKNLDLQRVSHSARNRVIGEGRIGPKGVLPSGYYSPEKMTAKIQYLLGQIGKKNASPEMKERLNQRITDIKTAKDNMTTQSRRMTRGEIPRPPKHVSQFEKQFGVNIGRSRRESGQGPLLPGDRGVKLPGDVERRRIYRNLRKPLKEDSKEALVALIINALRNKKKRKNYLLNSGYIGESKYDKSNLQCNKPKADPVGDSLTGKSHVVKACVNGNEKLIRFGQRGVKGSPRKKGESKAYASRRHRFQTRHAKNIARGPMSAAYWANKVKW